MTKLSVPSILTSTNARDEALGEWRDYGGRCTILGLRDRFSGGTPASLQLESEHCRSINKINIPTHHNTAP